MADTSKPTAAVPTAPDAVLEALRGAVASVEAAVVRLEGDDAAPGTVDCVLDLAGAEPAGDIVATHNVLTRAASIADHTGGLPDRDWQSIADLGEVLARTVTRLRGHVSSSLDDLGLDAAVGEHVELLQKVAVEEALGETLQLLVIVEDCLFLWHRVHLARTPDDELRDALTSARQVLADHFTQDAELLRRARAALARFAEGTPIEVVRRLSSGRTTKVLAGLRQDFDDFRWACRADEAGWLDDEDPVIAEALDSMSSPLKAVGGVLGDVFERGRARVTETWSRSEASESAASGSAASGSADSGSTASGSDESTTAGSDDRQ
ncbi:hypothetical protein LSF60_18100 [Rhodococcus pyridinivorans]|uniref:hypothetical protein n=1 Tax=Rhodococcus pyridinivorans TaxID=103816 RepID=UPI001E2FA528|nr:hypothetical protein [Rhodococcus pyridinivorans]UGQ57180.1 hypothetical protein LSF60_18100 [Rhodococcus pyridinivorans]